MRNDIWRGLRRKNANEKLTDENRQLDIEQKRLASIKSAAEQRLKDLDLALIAKEQAIIEQNKKLADATWQEYVTCLAAADRAWLAKEQGQVEAWLNRCPAEWRGWEWHYLQKHATGDCPQSEDYQLLADVKIEETTGFEAKPLVKKGPPLPYQISSIAAVSSDARRIGLWGRMLDVEGRPVARQTFLHVTDLDAISLSSSGSMYHIPYLARDTTWREVMVLSDDGRFLASAGEGHGNRRFIEVADLQERKVIVDRQWMRDGELPDLAFSENSDRFLAVSSDGWITTISLSASSGARPGAVLQRLHLPELIGAQSCVVQSSILHKGGMFAIVIRARVGELGLVNYPILVLWEDRNGELWPSEVHQLMLPPEFVEPPAAWQNTGGRIKREFKILPSVDQTKLAVVGDSTALIDLGKVAIVGDFRTPNIVGFSADGKRLLAARLERTTRAVGRGDWPATSATLHFSTLGRFSSHVADTI